VSKPSKESHDSEDELERLEGVPVPIAVSSVSVAGVSVMEEEEVVQLRSAWRRIQKSVVLWGAAGTETKGEGVRAREARSHSGIDSGTGDDIFLAAAAEAEAEARGLTKTTLRLFCCERRLRRPREEEDRLPEDLRRLLMEDEGVCLMITRRRMVATRERKEG